MLPLAGCGLFGDDGPERIAAIGPIGSAPNPDFARQGSGTALLLDATARGLVALDSEGGIESGLADRWTVIDDGRSYIFRLGDAEWDGGRRVVAADVAAALEQRMRSRSLPFVLRGEFDGVRSIRAMTTRVIEVQLERAQPAFIDLLAHPAMALQRRGAGWGPFRATRSNGTMALRYAPDPLAETPPDPAAPPDALLWSATGAAAVAQFRAEAASIIYGGGFADWPYTVVSELPQEQVLRDPVDGLFGLAVVDGDGLLGNALARDAIAMAIDRGQIVERIVGEDWPVRATLRTPRIAPGSRAADLPEPIFPAWIDMSMQERRSRARDIIASFADAGTRPVIRIALPDGPGADVLFIQLRRDLAAIGIVARRVALRADADLRLIDEIAPSDDPSWYLRRVRCRRGLLCDPANETLIDAIAAASDAAARNRAVAAADDALTRFGAYIPIAVPFRWTARAEELAGLRPNPRGSHSLSRILSAED